MPIKPGSPPPPTRKDCAGDRYHLRVLKELQDELRSARVIISDYDRERRKTKEKLRKAYECIGQLQQQLKDAKTLSKIREKKIFDAQFDTISISKVGEKVAALNEEILQVATIMGQTFIHKHRVLSVADLDAAAAVSQQLIGEKMTNILIARSQTPEPEVNPLLVQVVLKIFMVKFCVSKIRSWYPSDSTIEGFLSSIYSGIRSTEKQEVAGRWRALTRSNTRPSTETWEKELYKRLQSILIVSSWGARSPKDGDSYGDRLTSIFKTINELRTAIGENLTSADLDVFMLDCDKIYDPANMDYADCDGKQPSGKRLGEPEAIVGTTGIGLGKFIAETKDVLEIQILIPAKVVLWSTLNKALGPRLIELKKTKSDHDGANQDGRD